MRRCSAVGTDHGHISPGTMAPPAQVSGRQEKRPAELWGTADLRGSCGQCCLINFTESSPHVKPVIERNALLQSSPGPAILALSRENGDGLPMAG